MKVAIIGAGAAGLAAAYDLAGTGHEVVVFEAGEEVGGLAAGFKAPAWDWTLEKFYHHWFSTDQDVLDLIDEIGTGDKVRFYTPITSIWQPEGNYPLDAPTAGNALLSRLVNVLGIPGLSLIDKLRFGAVGMFLKLWPWGRALEKYTADAWLRRWVGERAHNAIWRPLLIGKFGEQYDRVNMAWMWARAYKRTASLGTYVGGFQAMLEDLANAVQARGANIRLSTPVENIQHSASSLGMTVHGETLPFDRVLVTTGPRLLLRLTNDLPEAYAQQVANLQSMGAIALILSLDRQLMTDNTYWLNLPAPSPDRDQNPFPFLALVEHTNYLSRDYYNGEHIVYLGDYLPRDHEHFRLSEEELADKFLPSLRQVNPDFTREWIQRQWVFRVPYAQPVPYVNHSQHIPAIRTPVEGLYWASMSQVYPWDRGTNYAVEIGRRTARMMMEDASADQ
jgi:protoporphyrinogen oxidase